MRFLKKGLLLLFIVCSILFSIKFMTSPRFLPFFSDFKNVLTKTNPALFGLALCIYLVSVIFSALSWNAVLEAFECHISVFQLIPVVLGGIFVNNITPFSRTGGETIRVYWLKERFRLPYSITILSVILSRVIELIPVTALSFFSVGALLKFKLVWWENIEFLFPIGTLIILAGVLIIQRRWAASLYAKLMQLFIRSKRFPETHEINTEFLDKGLRNKRALAKSLLFSSVLWILDVARLKVLASSLHLTLSWSLTVVASVLHLSLGLIAFTPGGVGFVEGGLCAGLTLLGVNPPEAAGLTVLERVISYFLSSAIGFWCVILLGGKQLWKSQNDTKFVS